MKRIATISFIFVILFMNFAYGETLVIWDLRQDGTVSKQEMDNVYAAFLRTVAEHGKGMKIILESNMNAEIQDESMHLKCEADDIFCISQVAGVIDVSFSISGSISKAGDSYMVELFLVDINNAAIKSKVKKSIYGSGKRLKFQFSRMICELFGEKNCEEHKAEVTLPATVENGANQAENTVKTEENILELKGIPSENNSLWKKATGWTLFGAGLGIVVGFGIGGYYKMMSEDDYSSYYRWSGVSTAGYVLGSIAVATGLSFIIWDVVEGKKEKNLSVQLVPSKDSFVVVFSGVW